MPLLQDHGVAAVLALNALRGSAPATGRNVWEEAIGHAINLGLHKSYHRLRLSLRTAGVSDSQDQRCKEAALAILQGDGILLREMLKSGRITPNSRLAPNNHPSITLSPTLLMLAAQAGDYTIVRLLLRAGADAALLDTAGQSAMSYAQGNDIRRLLQGAPRVG